MADNAVNIIGTKTYSVCCSLINQASTKMFVIKMHIREVHDQFNILKM